MTRVGSLALYNSTMKDVAGTQQKLAKLQQQISSGLKADTFEGLNGQVEQYTLLQAKIRTSERFTETNSVNIARLKTADQAMGQMVDIADSMENLITQGRSGGIADSASLIQQMKNLLAQMTDELNINFEGRYLFGGTNTNTAPVPDITTSSILENDSYYAGSNDNLVYQYDERSTFTWPVRGDDPAFQKIFAAANQAIAAFDTKNDSGMADALDLMQAGQTALNSARSQVNNTIINVQAASDRLDTLGLYWKGVSEEVVKTDLVSATTEVSNHEAILQAAFAVFSRLSQLRLSDYLK